MKWIARTLIFTGAMAIGIFAASLLSFVGGSGLTDCVVRFDPKPIPAQQPDGIRVMYNGWRFESDDRIATMKFVIYNGLEVPVIYRGYSATEALPEVRVNGQKFETWRCLNGVRYFQILPGRSAEIRVDRWEFPRTIPADATTTVGFHLYFSPQLGTPGVFAVSEPGVLPTNFRTVPLP
jgi:hypothetical protein